MIERGMDPAFDPERRIAERELQERDRQHKTDPYEQLELPFPETEEEETE